MTKDGKTGNNVVQRIRSFVFGKRKGMDRNNSCDIPSGNIKLQSLTDTYTKTTHQKNNRQQQKKDDEPQQQQQQKKDDEQQQQQQQQQQQKKKDEQQQQGHEQNKNENKKKEGPNEIRIPFLLFLKCAKKTLSTKKGRQQLFWESYSYFWHYLFENAAAKARMAEEEHDYDFYSDFDEEFY